MVAEGDGIVHPRAEVVEFEDAAADHRAVRRAGRLVILVALLAEAGVEG